MKAEALPTDGSTPPIRPDIDRLILIATAANNDRTRWYDNNSHIIEKYEEVYDLAPEKCAEMSTDEFFDYARKYFWLKSYFDGDEVVDRKLDSLVAAYDNYDTDEEGKSDSRRRPRKLTSRLFEVMSNHFWQYPQHKHAYARMDHMRGSLGVAEDVTRDDADREHAMRTSMATMSDMQSSAGSSGWLTADGENRAGELIMQNIRAYLDFSKKIREQEDNGASQEEILREFQEFAKEFADRHRKVLEERQRDIDSFLEEL